MSLRCVYTNSPGEKEKNIISVAYSSNQKNGPKSYVHKQNIATMEYKLLSAVRLVIHGGQCKLESPNWKQAMVLEMSWRKMR